MGVAIHLSDNGLTGVLPALGSKCEPADACPEIAQVEYLQELDVSENQCGGRFLRVAPAAVLSCRATSVGHDSLSRSRGTPHAPL